MASLKKLAGSRSNSKLAVNFRKSEMKPIGSIKPIKKPSGAEKKSAQKTKKENAPKDEALDTSDNASQEMSLLASLQILLRINSVERSISSIRDMADLTEGEFGYSDAVSAL